MNPIFDFIEAGDSQNTIALVKLKEKSDFHLMNEMGYTPLQWAIYHRQDEILEVLLDYGVDIFEKSRNGASPLETAAWIGTKDALQMLLKSGAWKVQEDLQRALHSATYDNNNAMIPILVSYGVKIGLVEAIFMNNVEMIEKIASQTDINNCFYGYPPLVYAVRAYALCGHNLVRLLINLGADVNFCCSNKHTPLIEAVRWSTVDVLHILLNHDADPYIISQENENVFSLSQCICSGLWE